MTRAPLVPRRTPPTVLAAALAAILLSATGCGTLFGGGQAASDPTPSGPTRATGPGQDPGSTTPSQQPPPAAPAVDTCRNLDFADISRFSNDSPTVPCSKPHTAYTFDVTRLPRSVDVAGASIANKSIQGAASRACNNAFASFIGGTDETRALSRLTVTYFLPPQAGFDLGASWVRCDVVAMLTPKSLTTLPSDVKGFLSTPHALDDYGLCAQGSPGTDTSVLVMCQAKHAFRALTAIRLGVASAPYPGTAVAGPGGQKQCANYLASKLGTTGGYTYGWTFPTASDWSSGQRFGYCWLKQSD